MQSHSLPAPPIWAPTSLSWTVTAASSLPSWGNWRNPMKGLLPPPSSRGLSHTLLPDASGGRSFTLLCRTAWMCFCRGTSSAGAALRKRHGEGPERQVSVMGQVSQQTTDPRERSVPSRSLTPQPEGQQVPLHTLPRAGHSASTMSPWRRKQPSRSGHWGVPVVAQWVKNLISIHGDADLIPGLA